MHHKELFIFFWTQRRIYIGIVIIACMATIGWIWTPFITHDGLPRVTWWVWLEPTSGVTTMAAALAIWIGEGVQDFENQLPKRLTFVFQKNGQEYFRCDAGYITHLENFNPWGGQQNYKQTSGPCNVIKKFLSQKVTHSARPHVAYTLILELADGLETNREMFDNIEKVSA
jgi:hypothetical protein